MKKTFYHLGAKSFGHRSHTRDIRFLSKRRFFEYLQSREQQYLSTNQSEIYQDKTVYDSIFVIK